MTANLVHFTIWRENIHEKIYLFILEKWLVYCTAKTHLYLFTGNVEQVVKHSCHQKLMD